MADPLGIWGRRAQWRREQARGRRLAIVRCAAEYERELADGLRPGWRDRIARILGVRPDTVTRYLMTLRAEAAAEQAKGRPCWLCGCPGHPAESKPAP